MAAEQSPPGEEPIHPASSRPSHQSLGRGAADPSEYSALIPQYEDAIVRIRQLEVQIEGLKRQVRDISSGANSPDTSGLLARIEALERMSLIARMDSLENRVAGSPESERPGDSGRPGRDDAPLRQYDDEIAQLRFQIATLATQLARAEGQLKQVNGTRPGRRNLSRHSSSKWKFWRRVVRR